MSENNICDRCGEVENKSHQLYECQYAKRMWDHYNKIIRFLNLDEDAVHSIEEAILPGKYSSIVSETLKSLVLKANIQIERPKHNSEKIIESLFLAQSKIEGLAYNRIKQSRQSSKLTALWKKLQLLLRNT
jgi:hypothetical protein